MATKLDKYTHVIKAVSEKGKTRFSYTNEYLKISGSNIDGHPCCV